ncbi:MAG: hypothetical protein IMX00_03065 [Limnochordales bacterium]|nr:hypothetical protein [Limnochordales bacterium]
MASEHLYSLYDLDEQTLVIINGDRRLDSARAEVFPECPHQVDRFHLARERVDICSGNKKVLWRSSGSFDKGPTGRFGVS